jgi:hypothetical protein
MTTSDFEELYGNKSSFREVMLFAPVLLREAYTQIGQNELFWYANLKRKPIGSVLTVEAKPEASNQTILSAQLQERFRQWIYALKMKFLNRDYFVPADIDLAERFLDEKWPEIRQLFRLRYLVEAGRWQLEKMDEVKIDEMFTVFVDTRDELFNILNDMLKQSTNAFFDFKSSRCYK